MHKKDRLVTLALGAFVLLPATAVAQSGSPAAPATTAVTSGQGGTTPSDAPAGGTLQPPPPVAAVPVSAPPAAPPPPPPPAEEDVSKRLNFGAWLRVDGRLQKKTDPEKFGDVGSTGRLELHLGSRLRKSIAWTANLIGGYGVGAGGGTIDGAGYVAILDLIAQLEPSEFINLWVGRMLVPSDRSNFSGPFFMAPWNYPGFVRGPAQGPAGRNDGATLWGQFGGGTLKYYAGVFNLHDSTGATTPLVSGRINVSLLNPEPGYYNSSTYYGKDLVALGLGGQYQKHGPTDGSTAPAPQAEYEEFNADLLFEKDLHGSGVVDVEGAFYKYVGDSVSEDLSYFGLASYLTPELAGVGKFQPLVRVQQNLYKSVGGMTPDASTAFDAQVGYVVDGYATRFALGFQHARSGQRDSNQFFAGIQLQK